MKEQQNFSILKRSVVKTLVSQEVLCLKSFLTRLITSSNLQQILSSFVHLHEAAITAFIMKSKPEAVKTFN